MALAAGLVGLIAGESAPALPRVPQSQFGPLMIDSATGRWLGLTNSMGRCKYALTGWGFRVCLEGATLDSSSAQSAQRQAGKDTLQVTYEYPDYRVDQLLREVPGTAFCDYTLRIHRNDGRGFFVERVECGRFAFQRAPTRSSSTRTARFWRTRSICFCGIRRGALFWGLPILTRNSLPRPTGEASVWRMRLTLTWPPVRILSPSLCSWGPTLTGESGSGSRW